MIRYFFVKKNSAFFITIEMIDSTNASDQIRFYNSCFSIDLKDLLFFGWGFIFIETSLTIGEFRSILQLYFYLLSHIL